MNEKTIQLIQHLAHDFDDDEIGYDYISEAIPLIGLVVMWFNALENSINLILCEIITDRTDVPGLIVINRLSYGTKVDLLQRFFMDFGYAKDPEINQLIQKLKELGKDRNHVVHADWMNTDSDGFTFVGVNQSPQGLVQKYLKISKEFLENLSDEICAARIQVDENWEKIKDHINN